MRYLLSIAIMSYMFMPCKAQTLKITYLEKMDLSKKLAEIEDPAIKRIVAQKIGAPKYFTLTGSDQISIYAKDFSKNVDNGSSANVTVMGDAGNEIIYKNHKKKNFVKQTNFMSRTFLIEDKLQKNDWKITDETKKIGNYLCRKAVLKRGENNITAWFSPEISSNEGPRDYYGLPGLILQVKTPSVIIEATHISISKEKVVLTKPTKGKKVSQKEFEKIKKEKIDNLTGGKKNDSGVQVIKM